MSFMSAVASSAQKAATLPPKLRSFLGLDALQLLWNSLEDEEGDKPAGHLVSLPGGSKRKNSYRSIDG